MNFSLSRSSSTRWRTPSTLVAVLLLALCVTYMAVGWSNTRDLAVMSQQRLRDLASSAPVASCVVSGGWRTSNKYARVVADRSLPERQLRKGIVSDGGDTSRSRRFLAKLLRGEAVTVVAIGGSITWGQGSTKDSNLDWSSRLFAWLRASFPAANHTLLNRAVPATPSSYMSLCVSWHVPRDADLVIAEYNINDGKGKADEARMAHERLLRKLLVYPNRPAVIELLFYRRPDNFTNEVSPYRYHGDDEMGVLAEYYHLPLLSCRALMWDLTTVPNPRPEHTWEAWTADSSHPNDVGHGYLADMVSTFLTRIMDNLDRHPLEAADDEAAAAELVPPMYRGNFAAKNNACLMGSQFKPLAVTTEGFAWIDEGTADKPKQGWVATTPGSVLEFVVATDVVPGTGSGSASVAAAIVYLSSYEHMGQAEVSCVEGCTCQSKTLNGHVVGRGTQQSIMLIEPSRAARCRLRVKVLPDTSSGEHKVKINGIIISETTWMIRNDIEVHPFRFEVKDTSLLAASA